MFCYHSILKKKIVWNSNELSSFFFVSFKFEFWFFIYDESMVLWSFYVSYIWPWFYVNFCKKTFKIGYNEFYVEYAVNIWSFKKNLTWIFLRNWLNFNLFRVFRNWNLYFWFVSLVDISTEIFNRQVSLRISKFKIK